MKKFKSGDVCAFMNSHNNNNGIIFKIKSGPYFIDKTDRIYGSKYFRFYKVNKSFEMSCGGHTKYIAEEQILKLKF